MKKDDSFPSKNSKGGAKVNNDILTIKTHESGFRGIYKNGKAVIGGKYDDDIVSFLRAISQHFPNGFTVNYGGNLSDADLERDFA